MRRVVINIPRHIHHRLQDHLFSGAEEQGAFLFANRKVEPCAIIMSVEAVHLIPRSGWCTQTSCHLHLGDEERVKVMQAAMKGGWHLIECHSHRHSTAPPSFSGSDEIGFKEWLPYISWKLAGTSYGALVWSTGGVAGRVWLSPPHSGMPVTAVRCVEGTWAEIMKGLVDRLKRWTHWLVRRSG